MPPDGTPQAILRLLNTELNKALRDPGVVKRLASQAVEAVPSTPQAVREKIVRETARWSDIMKKAGISASTAR